MSIDVRAPERREPPASGADFWTRDRVADALGLGPRGAGRFGRVWTDTRTLQTGDLFVALSGPNFDGHDFLARAVAAGAGGVVVSRPERAAGLGVPVYAVAHTERALGALARYRRRAWNGPLVGVVGSNGKTSTKEMLRAALGTRLEVHASEANYNNLVGVPLTLLAIPDHADVAVVELGTNQPGEIATLRAIAEPNIVVVTSIAEEHLEGLGDLTGVMREELAALDHVPLAVVPASQPEVVAAAAGRAGRVVAAGLDAGDLRADRWSVNAGGLGTAVVAGVDVRPPTGGVHHLRNAMLVLAVADACGVSVEDAARGIASARMPAMRGSVAVVGSALVINDAYNANPESVRAAVALLAQAGQGRPRVAVLGTMREMGPHTQRVHDEVARSVLAGPVELIVGIGEFADAFVRAGAPPSRVITAPDIDSAWQALAPRLAHNAAILLKGSRGMRLERLLPDIERWANSR
ncbi:MAG TPA: UDP-N-acetylmuramoyl-tripeptide--D-alanyl-D-alanine ligase [Gemmatimonadaceae bacterium]|nr:UDP-N-acetylmuramoyl-tripeptide--D-alanyl-D-alanine ligase [Gemmatimonadaceae bacterium]